MASKVKIECIKQGYQISNEMKIDIMDFYNRSLHQEHYAHKTDYIRHNLEEKYGRCFSVIIYQIGSFVSHSFLHADDFLLELRSPEHHILAYLLPPSYTPPPLIPDPQVLPLSRTLPHPLHAARPVQFQQSPQSKISNYPTQYSSYYANKYYDGYYRRGYW
ncbi:unnamed protein product [Paramecium sonneborni]|uniref:Uncharacterized protein n=1 Tax=Paramecium sonneborni TaxID=65129 RepID=A0A8S1RI77_9CILI|nr:unnamed protein product [Paramecium sonneborni]